jgi:hypothetical protein
MELFHQGFPSGLQFLDYIPISSKNLDVTGLLTLCHPRGHGGVGTFIAIAPCIGAIASEMCSVVTILPW